MKKTLLTLSTFFIFFLLLSAQTFAQEPPKTTTLPGSETINRDYFAGNERVVISGTVNGDIYTVGSDVTFDGTTTSDLMVAGGNVTISGNIGGDVRLAGGNVIFSGAEIEGNLTVAGGDVVIDKSTNITGSIVAFGGNLQFMGPIGKNLVVAGGQVTIGNNINGDVWSPGVGSLRLMNEAYVNGQLTYSSEQEAVISEGATIVGVSERRTPPVEKQDLREAVEKGEGVLAGLFLFILLGDILMSILLGLCLAFFFPNFVLKVADKALTSVGNSFLIGLVTAIITPIALLLFMLTIIGIPLSIALFVIFFLVLWFAKVLGSIALGRRILNIKKSELSYKPVFLGVILYFILGIVPIVGGLLQAFITLTGLGSLVISKKEYYKELRTKKIL